MRTKEYIRFQLDAEARAVHAWLESAADTAQRMIRRGFYVSSLEIANSEGDASGEQRRYGVFTQAGKLVATATLTCTDARTTTLELRRDDAFPLVAEMLTLMLAERFPGSTGEVLAEKPRGRAGAPLLACNVWLEDQLRLLDDPRRFHHLYPAWLERYVTLRGYEPVDPQRSFRAAVRGCLERMGVEDDA